MQKILQLKDIYNVEVKKSMYNILPRSYLLRLIIIFKLITGVHSYNTRQIKTRQFVLSKARSNSVLKW